MYIPPFFFLGQRSVYLPWLAFSKLIRDYAEVYNVYNFINILHSVSRKTLLFYCNIAFENGILTINKGYTANVYKGLQCLYEEIGVRGFQIYGYCMLLAIPGILKL